MSINDDSLKNDLESLTQKGEVSIPSKLPLIALRNAVIFPGALMPLNVQRKQSLKAIESALKSTDRLAMFVAQKEEAVEDPSKTDIYHVGCVGKIREVVRVPEGGSKVLIEGVAKAKITDIATFPKDGFVSIMPLIDRVQPKTQDIDVLMKSITNQFKQCVALGAMVPLDVLLATMNITNPEELVVLIILNIDFKVKEKQRILEALSTTDKLKQLNEALGHQVKILEMSKKLQTKTQQELGKMQREMFLQEQLKEIEKELGISGGKTELLELKEKIQKSKMPKETKEKVEKEFARLERMPSFSPEMSFLRTYIETMVDLPWGIVDKSEIDIDNAKKILDEDHYGLEKVKERVLEYLAVQKLVGKIKGPILCFAGPPGTGKTSIGKSIAKSLGRKFVRISLGGIHDEAEIRGHRRTYIGALPGRIIQGVMTAKTSNPVFMLDEIDKIGADFRGDPSAALLEALDPEQNNAFSDHYLESPYDLSDVMFITTANVLDTIPPALRDRLEVIEYTGYTEDEKYQIAKKYLVKKQMKNHGLTQKNLVFKTDGLKAIIASYTREAGVRHLDREIAAVCRKVAKRLTTGKDEKVEVTKDNVKDFLGPVKYRHTFGEKGSEIGVVAGLAWTQVGGEVLLIEANKMPGSGELILTGNMGKVMKESVQAALSYVKSRAKKLGIDPKDFSKHDVHVHVPSGAIPKDGPSAGLAMATALASVFTGRKVNAKMAMTGEITIRGKALEIGGLKEKVIAAHQGKIKEAICPKENEKDMEDIPDKVKNGLKFHFVDSMDEVIDLVLLK